MSDTRLPSLNVLDQPLAVCGTEPMTGFFRNGCCETGPEDRGSHTVCAIVTDAFLDHSKQQGNDLITPRPDYGFPGLKAGDRWCLCVTRWEEARRAGVAPPVVLAACHKGALRHASLEHLKAHAIQ